MSTPALALGPLIIIVVPPNDLADYFSSAVADSGRLCIGPTPMDVILFQRLGRRIQMSTSSADDVTIPIRSISSAVTPSLPSACSSTVKQWKRLFI